MTGLTHSNCWGTYFHDNLDIEEIIVDSEDKIESISNKFPFTKVLEIS